MRNPITGIEHELTDTGWSPTRYSFVLKSGNFKTAVMEIPVSGKEKIEEFDKSMAALAKGLSEITGRNIEWRHLIDNECSVWGDYGFFIVQK